jgi:hypothetical protein
VSVKQPSRGQFTWSKTSQDKSPEASQTSKTTGVSKSYGRQKTTETKAQDVEM